MTGTRHVDELLRTLRHEMSALDIGDDDARRRLDALIADIEARVGDADGGVDAGLIGHVKASMLRFEASHPRLAGVINDVVDKLSAMGI